MKMENIKNQTTHKFRSAVKPIHQQLP